MAKNDYSALLEAYSKSGSPLPKKVLFDMMELNTPFDQAMREWESRMNSEYDDPMDDMWEELMNDEDTLSKAIYQTSLARAGRTRTTPYGFGLSEEELDAISEMYPGIASIKSIDTIDQQFRDAETLLRNAGVEIDDALEAAQQRAADDGDMDSIFDIIQTIGTQLGDSVRGFGNRGENVWLDRIKGVASSISDNITNFLLPSDPNAQPANPAFLPSNPQMAGMTDFKIPDWFQKLPLGAKDTRDLGFEWSLNPLDYLKG